MYKRSYCRINPQRMAVIAYCIEQYVSGRSINDIEAEVSITGPTIGRFLTVHYFKCKALNTEIMVLESKINSVPVKVKKYKPVKKPIYWCKGEYKPMPAHLHQDYQLKRMLTIPQICKY